MLVGIDVGGTNTDAVLISDRDVLAAVKRPTTADADSGVRNATAAILEQAGVATRVIDAVIFGTTHLTNAFVPAAGAYARCRAFALAFPAARGVPPFSGWLERLRGTVYRDVPMVAGGLEFDGRPIAQLDEAAAAP